MSGTPALDGVVVTSRPGPAAAGTNCPSTRIATWSAVRASGAPSCPPTPPGRSASSLYVFGGLLVAGGLLVPAVRPEQVDGQR